MLSLRGSEVSIPLITRVAVTCELFASRFCYKRFVQCLLLACIIWSLAGLKQPCFQPEPSWLPKMYNVTKGDDSSSRSSSQSHNFRHGRAWLCYIKGFLIHAWSWWCQTAVDVNTARHCRAKSSGWKRGRLKPAVVYQPSIVMHFWLVLEHEKSNLHSLNLISTAPSL